MALYFCGFLTLLHILVYFLIGWISEQSFVFTQKTAVLDHCLGSDVPLIANKVLKAVFVKARSQYVALHDVTKVLEFS